MRDFKDFDIPIHKSLVFRAQISVFLLLLTIFSVILVVSEHTVRELENAELQEDITYIQHITSESLAMSVWNLDSSQATRQLMALKNRQDFCGARISDIDGNTLASVDYNITEKLEKFVSATPILFEDITGTNPQNSIVVGSLHLCIDTSGIDRRISEQRMQYMLIFLIMLPMIMGACFFSQHILTKRLTKARKFMHILVKDMQPITDKDLLEENEIGALTHTYNSMIEELKETIQSLADAKISAEKAGMAKTDFLANMTHELRTPLNSIIGMTRLLRERRTDVDEKEMLRIISEASSILLETVNDILDITKIESGGMSIKNTPFDLAVTIRRSLDTIEQIAKGKNIAFEYTLAKKLPIVIGDSLRVTQVMNNLLGNAVKFTDKGGVRSTFTIVEQGNNKIELQGSITDTGPGIPDDKIGSLFTKFTQIESTNTKKHTGTGLGLAITKELIELMGGTIGVKSQKGKGTTFWFKIPFEITDTLEANLESHYARRISVCGVIKPENARILIAEDNPLNQAFIKMLMAKYHIQHFEIYENGKDVLNAALNKEYDVVLMDCFMPEMSGFDVTRSIRVAEKKTGNHLPIVAVTANAMSGDDAQCLDAGMDDYIAKPIVETEFVEVLSRWLHFSSHQLLSAAPSPESVSSASVNSIVNLDIIKSFSANNTETQKKLLNLFLTQSEKHIKELVRQCVDGKSDSWVISSHSLKGGSASIGAEILRDLCAKAQAMETATAEDRRDILNNIRQEYDKVQAAIQKIMA